MRIPPILLEGDEPVKEPVRAHMTHMAEAPDDLESGELPEAFGTGKLLLIPRDPTSLYAAWDFTAEQQQRANAQSIDRHMVLLIRKGGTGKQLISEIQVHPESRHWFATVPIAGESYSAELGYYDTRRNWCTMAVSSIVATPRGASPSLAAEFQMAEVQPGGPALQENKAGVEERTIVQEAAPTPPPAAQISSVADQIPGLPQVLSPIESPEAHERVISTSEAPSAPAPPPADTPVSETPGPAIPQEASGRQTPEWTKTQAREILELAGVLPGETQALGSIEIVELLARYVREGGRISSIESAGAAGVEQPTVPVPTAISSFAEAPGKQVPTQQGKFWFQVNAELVIYGATEPNATVTIGRRAISLRDDGSFSYRFALPDGKYDLPIEARSPEGDTRGARMTFSRETVLSGEVGIHPQDASLKKPAPENVT